MAKIISLGCDVAEIYRCYADVHSALFGAKSYHLIVEAFTRKEGYAYANCECSLGELQDRLTGLETDISELGENELSSRAAADLRRVLLDYIQSLRVVIVRLKEICRHLVEDERGYREASATGHSRFNRDKVDYDHSIRQLERTGTQLNKLFSSY